jgi:hypothetical protein
VPGEIGAADPEVVATAVNADWIVVEIDIFEAIFPAKPEPSTSYDSQVNRDAGKQGASQSRT